MPSSTGCDPARHGGSSGQASVEFALALPIVVVMALGLVLVGAAWAEAQEDGITGLNIARGLRKVSAGTEVTIGTEDWTTVRATFDANMGVDVSGA